MKKRERFDLLIPSLWRDLNSRLPPYQGGTLPGCVTQAIVGIEATRMVRTHARPINHGQVA